jgi:hypothetical protein
MSHDNSKTRMAIRFSRLARSRKCLPPSSCRI